ncbi:MAG: hypothetical protein LBS30_01665 [Planctomycetota bacterium]|jgi:hypothetical protein|nr:hypothetical protein [Planctomycetota bacterium]
MAKPTPDFKWTFHRMGGLDQVEFNKGEEVFRLGELDPKLWVALSCPAKGLEFDSRTLFLLDTDRDGRIRIPEIVAAAEWFCARLKNPDAALRPEPALPLDAINDSTAAGRRLVATARAVLDSLGKPEASSISQEDICQAVLHASEQMFNGDGILPPLDGLDEGMRGYIGDAIRVVGGVDDIGGRTGINKAISASFIKTLSDWRDWNGAVLQTETPLGKSTPECWRLLAELKDKIDDYFMRCELAAYSPASQNALNMEDKPLTNNETGLLEAKALSELPLSKAGPDKPLDLKSGLNPAWRDRIELFAALIRPYTGDSGELTREAWLRLQADLEPYSRAVAGRPAPVIDASVTTKPAEAVEMLGEERIGELLRGDWHEKLSRLADEDANGPAASTDIADLERMTLYYLHFIRLLRNFVNFGEFYDQDHTAAFQSGSLFIDGRSCRLCMPAGDVEAHSAIAKSSQLFLLYCECARGMQDGRPEAVTNVVAAVTAGDSDLLTQNRNGVYVDSRGNDWDARVVKVVSNPIDLRQAVWSPYKKFGALIAEQLGKYASEKQAGLMDSAGKKLNEVGTQVAAGAAPRFDVGRNVGVFAAVGLALGAIGTAVGSIVNALLSMSWWQLPLLLSGIFIVISGPSVLMAWLTLRQRTLGPLLEASGWAINGRVRLGYGVARRLSGTAELPPNSRRSELDARARLKRIRRCSFWIAVLAGALLVGGWLAVQRYRSAGIVREEEGVAKALNIITGDLEAKMREIVEEARKATEPAEEPPPPQPAAPAPNAPAPAPEPAPTPVPEPAP